jgi:methionyl-tRNA formyltransferase
MLRVFIITQEEPFFIPKMINKLTHEGGSFRIVGATVLKPHRKNKSIRHWARERTKIYSWKELFIALLGFTMAKTHRLIFRKSGKHSPSALFNKKRIPLYRTHDINSNAYLNEIKKINLDIIFSISCPQIFQEELLNTPKHGCYNAHGTLLPRHRGVFGSWWTLYSGDRVAGSTIHKMVSKLDAGDIVWQQEFPVEATDTQYAIAFKTKRDMTNGLLWVLSQLYSGNKLQPILSPYSPSYHKAPTKLMGEDFRKKGLRIIRLRDLSLIFNEPYA